MNPTPTEIQSMAAHFQATGVPQSEIDAFVMSAEGAPPTTAAEPGSVLPPADAAAPASPQELAMLEADVKAPDSLSAYQLPYAAETEFDPAARQADTTIRGWMADANLSAATGSAIAQEADKYMQRVAGFDDARHQLEAQTTHSMLQKTWGTRTNEMLGYARSVVAQLDAKHQGAVTELLESSGLGNCPGLVVQLAHHGERLAALAKAKGAKR